MQQWSNQACMGYAILAAESAGIKPDVIKEIIQKMHRQHDEKTIEEAAEYYRDSDF